MEKSKNSQMTQRFWIRIWKKKFYFSKKKRKKELQNSKWDHFRFHLKLFHEHTKKEMICIYICIAFREFVVGWAKIGVIAKSKWIFFERFFSFLFIFLQNKAQLMIMFMLFSTFYDQINLMWWKITLVLSQRCAHKRF